MRKRLRENSLSVVMFGLFGLCLLGHSLAGYAAYHDDQQAHQQPPSATRPMSRAAIFGPRCLKTGRVNFCRWRPMSSRRCFAFSGARRNRKTRIAARRSTRTRASINTSRRPPGRCGRGGSRSRSMPIPSPRRSPYCSSCPCSAMRRVGPTSTTPSSASTARPPCPCVQYLGTARFWFESFQNWQSEFLAVGTVVVLSIWLRERGSPESKPVHRAHAETGR